METPPTVLLCRDLMFVSKVTATARAAGAAVKVLRDPAQLAGSPARRLLVDLAQEGALDAAAAWKAASPESEVIGFVSHVDGETIARAQRSGIDRVMTRGAFSAGLEGLLGPSAGA